MTERRRLSIRGCVQGVGFRPFVYRLARESGLRGWVTNSPQGVEIEVEGTPAALEDFLSRLATEKPPLASIHSLEAVTLDPAGYAGFEIRESVVAGERRALVLPDIATCSDCLADVDDATNRRYRYPFTNCTNCGPRYSIILSLPYDRERTTMRGFTMCAQCRAEYEDPRDRRFHAQPNACPVCGPHLELWDRSGEVEFARDEALRQAAAAVRDGAIVAVKGIGGFHLVAHAGDEGAVQRLRERKRREEKPFALMFADLTSIEAECEISTVERRILTSPERPIVLLARRRGIPSAIVSAVAPSNPNLGAMLPYAPLHHLLLREIGGPIVATSGNLSDEPICTDERDALARLEAIADVFLVHNRPIARHVDDSIVREIAGREMMLRRARGFAPLPRPLPAAHRSAILAVGPHLKNTLTLAVDDNAFVSQHIGDLETAEALDAFRRVAKDLSTLFEVTPTLVVRDVHPDYLSSIEAEQMQIPLVQVQHHYAHVLSCMADNEVDGRCLGVAWDGVGLGTDGTIWGGEFLLVDSDSFRRFACLRRFRLPGGDAAAREPRRSAAGALAEILGDAAFENQRLREVFTAVELHSLRTMITGGVNSPRTSSAGRLFDAVASLVGLRQVVRHEGQAAMELEFLAAQAGVRVDPASLPVAGAREDPSLCIVDWEPLLRQILAEPTPGRAAVLFHETLVEAIVTVARRAGEERVMLSGGCFQNRYLLERAIERLREAGFHPCWHQRIPPNDGGISLGQAVAGLRARLVRSP